MVRLFSSLRVCVTSCQGGLLTSLNGTLSSSNNIGHRSEDNKGTTGRPCLPFLGRLVTCKGTVKARLPKTLF